MKRLAFFLVSTAMFVSGVSAFAFGRADTMRYSYNQNSTTPVMSMDANQIAQSVQQWVGKPADELVKQLGNPDYTSATNDGSKIYDYVRNEPQRTRYDSLVAQQFEFVIGSNGDVTTAKVSAF
jgi:hypothetical protein